MEETTTNTPPNKIKGKLRKKNKKGEYYLYPKPYVWYIPKALRKENIQVGDIVQVKASGKMVFAQVVDVFREEGGKNQMVKRVVERAKNTQDDT